MRLVTKVEFLDLYEEGMLSEIFNAKDRVIARNVKGQADNPQQYEIVYALV